MLCEACYPDGQILYRDNHHKYWPGVGPCHSLLKFASGVAERPKREVDEDVVMLHALPAFHQAQVPDDAIVPVAHLS